MLMAESIRQDLRSVFRGLRRSPGLTAVIITTFGLGIGANAAMFGIVDRVLLSAPPRIVRPDGVARIYFDRPAAGMWASVSQVATYPSLALLRDRDPDFAEVAMYEPGMRVFGTGVDARQVHTLAASANFFPLLGVRPALGRFYLAAEDQPPAGTPRAVLGYGFWQSQFGGANVLGRVIDVDDVHYTVVGVAPRGFTGVDIEPVDVFLPLSTAASGIDPSWNTARYMLWVQGIARMRPGAPAAGAAGARATQVVRSAALALDGPKSMDATATVRLGPIPRALGPETGQVRTRGQVAEWLSGVSLVLVLVACANVANLLLARAMRRRRELAVRIALGAARARLAAMLLLESLVLALAGGVAGIAVALAGGRVMHGVLLPDAAPGSGFDLSVAVVAGLAVLATGLLAGVLPALHVGRRDLGTALKATVRDGGGARSRVRTALLIAQTALSVMLLVGAGLFVRSLRNIRAVHYGYDPDHVLLVSASFPGGMAAEARSAAWDRLVERARTLPGVSHASLAMTAPFWSSMSGQLLLPSGDTLPQTAGGRPYVNAVAPDYFETMGSRVLDGRAFTNADGAGAPHVMIVNRTVARTAWPGQRAVGKCLRTGANAVCTEVVGVVEDETQHDIQGEAVMQFYVPLAQVPPQRFRVMVLRTSGDPDAAREPIRRALSIAEPSAGFLDMMPLRDRIEPQVRSWTLGATLFTIFGALALATAILGLYSVVAYAVAQRTHEFGVRAALGATASRLLGGVIGEGMRVAAIGLLIGGAAALVATRWIASLLFDVRRDDPWVFGIVGVTLFAASLAASAVPAWRAARADPASALREE